MPMMQFQRRFNTVQEAISSVSTVLVGFEAVMLNPQAPGMPETLHEAALAAIQPGHGPALVRRDLKVEYQSYNSPRLLVGLGTWRVQIEAPTPQHVDVIISIAETSLEERRRLGLTMAEGWRTLAMSHA